MAYGAPHNSFCGSSYLWVEKESLLLKIKKPSYTKCDGFLFLQELNLKKNHLKQYQGISYYLRFFISSVKLQADFRY
jgi:hypothetical protein